MKYIHWSFLLGTVILFVGLFFKITTVWIIGLILMAPEILIFVISMFIFIKAPYHISSNVTDYFSGYSLNDPDKINEVIILDWLNGKQYPTQYPSKLFQELNINNPKKYHKKLIDENWLIPASSEEFLRSLKVKELKDLLRENNLTVSGNKNQLIERILYEVTDKNINEFRKRNKKDAYVLSPKSETLLNKNDGALLLFEYKDKWDIELDKYFISTDPTNNKDFPETMNLIVNVGLELGIPEMREILMEYLEETEQYESLLIIYLENTLIDLINYMIDFSMEYYFNDPKSMVITNKVIIQPYINETVKELKELYKPNMINYIYTLEKYRKFIPKRKFKAIIKEVLNGKPITEEYLYQLLS